MTHPLTDPWHAGAVLTPAQMLVNRGLFRQRPGGGMSGGELSGVGSPLAGIGEAIGSALDAAGYRPPEEHPQPVQSDADAPRQGVFSDGNDLYHVRDNGDSTTSVAHLGSDGLSAQQGGGV